MFMLNLVLLLAQKYQASSEYAENGGQTGFSVNPQWIQRRSWNRIVGRELSLHKESR